MSFPGFRDESLGFAASDFVVNLAVASRVVSCVCQSKKGFERLVAPQRTLALQPLRFPELDCILRSNQHIFALRHHPWASVGLLGSVFPSCHWCLFWEKELAEFRTALHPMNTRPFLSSTLIRASGVPRVPDTHSSKMSWWKMARASAPS